MRTRRNTRIALVAVAALAASGTVAYAVTYEPDGVNLQSQWVNGGSAKLELEDRNVEPTICFVWDNPAPQDGDSFESRVLTREGAEVVDLGTADQWVDGAGEGCEIPRDNRYRDVFANPGDYVVEFRVVENQGTAPTAPVRSLPLAPATA
jgi:hypothetical protein